MTSPQRTYLSTLAAEANEEEPGEMTKAEASERIDRLQAKTGRGPYAHDDDSNQPDPASANSIGSLETESPTDEAIAQSERPNAGRVDEERRLEDLQTAQDAGDFGASGEPG